MKAIHVHVSAVATGDGEHVAPSGQEGNIASITADLERVVSLGPNVLSSGVVVDKFPPLQAISYSVG